MFGNKLKRSCKESIKYIANSLVSLSKDGNGNVIGVSSSRICKSSKGDICEKICEEIKNKGIDVVFIDIDAKKDKKENDKLKKVTVNDDISIQKFENLIAEHREKSTLVIVNIPSIAFVADSVEYSKVCGRVVLLEKYMYSTYKDYEEALIRLKSHGVRIDGVIGYSS